MLQYQGVVEALDPKELTFTLRTTDKEGKEVKLPARVHSSCAAPPLKDGMRVVAAGDWPAVIGGSSQPSFSVRELSASN